MPDDRAAHGETLCAEVNGAVSTATERRSEHGIEDESLLVLELESSGGHEGARRKMLEALGFRVLREDVETQALPEERRIVVDFEPEDGKAAKLREAVTEAFEVDRIDRLWPRQGEARENRMRLVFTTEEDAQCFADADEWHRAAGLEKVHDVEVVEGEERHQVTVQASDPETIDRFREELRAYCEKSTQELGSRSLTVVERKKLFDALRSLPDRSPGERAGPRLGADPSYEGVEYLDVDLWHPGADYVQQERELFDAFVSSLGGRITDTPKSVADTMLLTRVEVDVDGARALLRSDLVARVDRPPVLEIGAHASYEEDMPRPDSEPDPDGPIACALDSGVVSGHPLLSGRIVVEAADFRTGEDDPADNVGHGTHIAGTLVYGDMVQRMETNEWNAAVRLLSGKLMSRSTDANLDGDHWAVFDDEKRVETQIREAVDYFVSQYNCRVFNVSFGHQDVLLGPRHQLPWACLLDELARQYDIVFVVSTGNHWPEVPEASDTRALQAEVFKGLLREGKQVMDPASAVNALTVGGLARRDTPGPSWLSRDRRPPPVAAPRDCPSPFTRTGLIDKGSNGPSRCVKPEVVAYAGNMFLGLGNSWQRDRPLREPSLNSEWAARRPFSWEDGTSFAAPQVAHICALVEHEYREDNISANLIRALVVHSARVAENIEAVIQEGLTESEEELVKLRTVGYGRPDGERACFSTDRRVTLVAEDLIPDDEVHVYQILLPDGFFEGHRQRQIRATLAYDPPVRGSRLEYIGRTMRLRLLRGIPEGDIVDDIPPDLAKARPAETMLQWSTVQSRVFTGSQQRTFERSQDAAPATWSLVVQSQRRFEIPQEPPEQRYAIVMSLEDEDNEDARLYEQVRQTIRITADQRVRIEVAG